MDLTDPRFLIYGLRDPRTQEIRYVGKSAQGLRRPPMHWGATELRRSANTYRGKWIQSLLREGLRPEIVVLEACNSAALDDAERRWIALGRAALGERFTNGTHGGNGGPTFTGRRHTPETRARMRASAHWGNQHGLGYRHTAEARARISAAATERYKDPERRRAISVRQKGRVFTPEWRAKIAETVRRLPPRARNEHGQYLPCL